MVTMKDLIARAQRELGEKIAARGEKQAALLDLRDRLENGDDEVTREVVAALGAERDMCDADVRAAQDKLDTLLAEQERDEEIAALQSQHVETGVSLRSHDQVVRVGQEARTYNPETDATGRVFLADVLRSQLMGDMEAQQRLGRHMAEERVERGAELTRAATTTANFAGLVVPQYLTDLVAPYAKAARPFADAVRKHPLPESGMTVNISRITTATTVAVQTQGTDVSETNIDDTLLTVNVLTNAGSQTVTRQAAERGDGVLDVVLEDLLTSYHTNLDNELLNQATNGLATVGTGVTFTDNTSPTAVEAYGFIAQAASAVETALKNQGSGDTIIVMHPRRWWWFSAAVSASHPVLGQSGSPAGVNAFGADFAARYGSGFRGVIAGMPVIVDANIATNLGTGTNQDEIYVLSASESHLWETPNAPLFIRTDTGPSIKSLGVDLVVYGYFAFTHVRYSHAQRITGTGLVTPVFSTIT